MSGRDQNLLHIDTRDTRLANRAESSLESSEETRNESHTDKICGDMVTLTLNTDVLESMLVSTADDLMKVFQRYSISREEDETVKADILNHLNTLKDSLLLAGREQTIASVKGSKPVSLKSSPKPTVSRTYKNSTTEDTTSVRKGKKRPNLSTDENLPESKVTRVENDSNESKKELSQNTNALETFSKKPPVRDTCTTQNTSESLLETSTFPTPNKATAVKKSKQRKALISNDTFSQTSIRNFCHNSPATEESTPVRKDIERSNPSTSKNLLESEYTHVEEDHQVDESRKELSKNNNASVPTQSTSEKCVKMPKKAPSLVDHVAKRKASLEKPPTNPQTKLGTQGSHVDDLHELSEHESSQARMTQRAPPAIKAERGPNNVRRKSKHINGKKRISRCSKKEKHLCAVCSQPDCGECKNCQ